MSSIHKVAVAGASGILGTPVLHAIIAAGFEVTVLTRQSSTATFPPSVKVVKVDYESVESLTTVLRGQDALISTVTTSAVGSQTRLVDAAVAAGVKRFLPSEFGADESLETIKSLPMYNPKIDIQEYTKQKCAGTQTSWTVVYCNAFWDWALDAGFYVDLKNKKIRLYDGGDFKITTTPTDFVGNSVAAILRHPDETANREVRIQGGLLTQREILAMAQRVVGSEGWTVEEISTLEEEKKALKNFQEKPDDIWGWIFGMIVRGQFGEGFSRSFEGNDDNAVLGLKQLTEVELEAYMWRWVEKGGKIDEEATGKRREAAAEAVRGK